MYEYTGIRVIDVYFVLKCSGVPVRMKEITVARPRQLHARVRHSIPSVFPNRDNDYTAITKPTIPCDLDKDD